MSRHFLIINFSYDDYKNFIVNKKLTSMENNIIEEIKVTEYLASLLANNENGNLCYGAVGYDEKKSLTIDDFIFSNEHDFREVLPFIPNSVLAGFEINEEKLKLIPISLWWEQLENPEEEIIKEEDLVEPIGQSGYWVGITTNVSNCDLTGLYYINKELIPQSVVDINKLQEQKYTLKILEKSKKERSMNVLLETQLAMIKTSPAKNGPFIISEDIIRMLKLYNAKECYEKYSSIRNEIQFLFQAYGNKYKEYINNSHFYPLENMDIIWTYSAIEDRWQQLNFFNKKVSHLKYLKDILIQNEIYEYYEKLEPFQLMENMENIEAVIKDSFDLTPLAYDNGVPVTDFHKRMNSDAQKVFRALPENFSCLGYNFTKQIDEAQLRTTCGLALYKYAEFDVTDKGFLITTENIKLYDYKKLVNKQNKPLLEIGSVKKLEEDIKVKGKNLLSETFGDKALTIDSLFSITQLGKLNPLLGNNIKIKEILKLLDI